MNADQIYQLQRDEAFAGQFIAQEYQTFLAMPFGNRGGYQATAIRELLSKVHERANTLLPKDSKRKFAPLRRVDEITAGTVVITDEIIREILYCHFFLGDLTGCNFGVVLEAGLALALKPNRRVLLFTQDGTHSLHFDVSVTRIASYTHANLVEQAARELVNAAIHFEEEADNYIRLLSSQLTPDAIVALNIYGRLWIGWTPDKPKPSIWEDTAALYSERFREAIGKVTFHNVLRELSGRRLFWTDYRVNQHADGDSYGIHATKLGWRVIEHLWAHDKSMREPPNAPTGPSR